MASGPFESERTPSVPENLQDHGKILLFHLNLKIEDEQGRAWLLLK